MATGLPVPDTDPALPAAVLRELQPAETYLTSYPVAVGCGASAGRVGLAPRPCRASARAAPADAAWPCRDGARRRRTLGWVVGGIAWWQGEQARTPLAGDVDAPAR
ncbi:hypothetical protein IU11_10425 [Cellulosimicrobium sp. MM]|nr:hypothetical protein IU11_10425 [Cellulosimicrobium sp. MM]